MPKPFFSIIIPALNEEKYLPNLLSDLVAQTFRDFEVIVVDGHSDDATVKVAKKFSRRLPLKILNSPKRHVCVQRNLGGSKARADTYIFMDADNRLPPSFLQGIKYRWESRPTDIATTWIQPENSTTYYKTISVAINLYYEILSQRVSRPGILESMVIIHKNVFDDIDGFNSKLSFGEGFDLISAIISKGYSYSVYKDPQYVYSLRRLRKYGTLKSLSAIAKAEIASITGHNKSNINIVYPMLGGGAYEQDRASKFIDTLLTKLKKSRSRHKFLNSLSQFYQDFLTD